MRHGYRAVSVTFPDEEPPRPVIAGGPSLWTPEMPHEVTEANGFPEDYWEGEYRGYNG